MTADRLKLAEDILKDSIAYRIGQVSYKIEAGMLIVWTNDSENLNNVNLVQYFIMFSVFARYQNNRVELVIC